MSIIKRREFLGGFIGGMLAHELLNRKLLAQEKKLVTIQWRVPQEQVVMVRDELNFKGEIIPDKSTIDDDRGLPLIYIFVGAVVLGYLAKTLLEIYKDVRYGGIIIHRNKQGELVIENNPSLDKGTIIIDKGAENTKIIFKEKDNPQEKDLIKALSGLINK